MPSKTPILRFRSSGPMTLNNYTHDELEHLRGVTSGDSKIKYICWIQETGENGTPHLQIYAQAYEKLSVKQWHKYLGDRIANIVPTVDQEKAIAYCKGYKDGQPKPGSDLDSVEEYGRKPEHGQRNDLIAAADEIRKRPLSEIMEQGGENEATIIKHYKYYRDLDSHMCAKRAYDAGKEEHNAYLAERQRQPWEYKLKEIVESEEKDTRVIHWFVDTIGESGKTVNGKDLYYNHNAFYCTGGKASDIYHAYNYQGTVVFNLVASACKETMEYLYKVLEEFKDGIFSSGKYSSVTKSFKIPRVIVFSNDYPETEKMKKNRIQVYDVQTLNGHKHDFSPPGDCYVIN